MISSLPLVALLQAIAFYAAQSPFSSAASIRSSRPLCPDGIYATFNDACCPLFGIRDALNANIFSTQCGANTRLALRLTFHDALGYSTTQNMGNGADGSIIQYAEIETNYPENAGLNGIIEQYLDFYGDQQPSLSYGDFIQFAAAVGLSSCPGAPTLKFLMGRPNATVPAVNGAISGAADTSDAILARFADAGFNAEEVVALLASHSIAKQSSFSNLPLDSTPALFDTQYYAETMLKGTLWPGPPNITGEAMSPTLSQVRLDSDVFLAQDPRTACIWQDFVDEQQEMQIAFQAAMLKMSLLGQDRNQLIDCSEVIEDAPPLPHQAAYFPRNFTTADVNQTCASKPFPDLPSAPSPVVSADAANR